MVYRKSGRRELKYIIWKRMSSLWKKACSDKNKLASTLYNMKRLNSHETSWCRGIKNTLINCSVPMIPKYDNIIGDASDSLPDNAKA